MEPRSHKSWFPTLLRYQAHGCATAKACQNAERDSLLAEGRGITEEKLEKLHHEQQEAYQELAEAKQCAELEVTAKSETTSGLEASGSNIKASVVCLYACRLRIVQFAYF